LAVDVIGNAAIIVGKYQIGSVLGTGELPLAQGRDDYRGQGNRALGGFRFRFTDLPQAVGPLGDLQFPFPKINVIPRLGDELRALRALKREVKSPFIFVSERGAPFSTSGFAKLVERAGIEAKMPFKVHPHMLRHSTGYALANKGIDTRTLQAYLGHRSIQSTVRYTELAPGRFKNLWR
jgi:integrase